MLLPTDSHRVHWHETLEASALRTNKPVLKKNLGTQGLGTRTWDVRRARQDRVGLREDKNYLGVGSNCSLEAQEEGS